MKENWMAVYDSLFRVAHTCKHSERLGAGRRRSRERVYWKWELEYANPPMKSTLSLRHGCDQNRERERVNKDDCFLVGAGN